jgi:hypothetical protein
MRIYYFGCAGEPGHYLWEPGLHGTSRFKNPWGNQIDTGLCPKGTGYEVEGEAALHKKDGFTAISFWDRSGDSRHQSNSSFIAQGDFTFGQMLELAKQHFPQIMARFKFQIVEIHRNVAGKEFTDDDLRRAGQDWG